MNLKSIKLNFFICSIFKFDYFIRWFLKSCFKFRKPKAVFDGI